MSMESIGIGTYSFGMKRGLSTQEKLKRAAECGYTGVELLTKDLEENTVEELQQWLAENLLLQGESKAKYRLCFYDHIGNLIEEKAEISLEKPLEIPQEAMLVTGETVV